MYHRIAVECFRYFGFHSFREVDQLTIPQYEILSEAYELRLVDEEKDMHWQAFLNFAVQAKKKVGKHKSRPVYTKFEKFFDYKARLSEVQKKKNKKAEKFKGIGAALRKGGA